ncbi:MAG: cob(I)yrinic acid a,c-diamide adenosyltransferase [Muribaculaceae bacterium]|nr:cob(I)yrinic acid a,c-diamide adenosyltransferase [Muribaculaceae bacterium]MBR1551485.1 cob(I)yrinic acid a,c-diamide adenosyltransferase [Muribaculaceae bacterium]
MNSKVYTLTGDKGTTALVGGKRVNKDDARVEAYGTIDELNAHLGLLAHNTKLDEDMPKLIRKIQNKLFNIGAYLATENATEPFGLTQDDVALLEKRIDEMDAGLPPMQGFILPGGSRLSALCDICRTITRRAERRVVTLSHTATVHPLVLQYLNRLSDFFFVFARFNNIQNQVEEIYWEK